MLFLGFSIILPSLSMAQDSTKVTSAVVYNDVKTLVTKIEGTLTALGKTLKIGAPKVWDILIKQQLVVGITGVIYIVVNFIFILYWKRYYNYVNDMDYGYGDVGQWPAVIVLGIVLAGTTVSNGMNVINIITAFLNPEFGAMKTIAEIASQIR